MLLSQRTGLPAGDFALLGNASEGIARVVSPFDWQKGDNAVVSALDYTSGKSSFSKLGQAGVKVHLVQPDGMFIDTDALIADCDAKTRLIYISQVNAHTGQRIDLRPLSQALRDRGIALLVDASHALAVYVLRTSLEYLSTTPKAELENHATGLTARNSVRSRWEARHDLKRQPPNPNRVVLTGRGLWMNPKMSAAQQTGPVSL